MLSAIGESYVRCEREKERLCRGIVTVMKDASVLSVCGEWTCCGECRGSAESQRKKL